MKYFISKEKVIEAILNETLIGGSFFHSENLGYLEDMKGCPVCAVGAVMRATSSLLGPSECSAATGYHCIVSDTDNAYDSGNFLSILSCEFETAYWYHLNTFGDEDLPRFHALMIAEGFCPDVLEFEI